MAGHRSADCLSGEGRHRRPPRRGCGDAGAKHRADNTPVRRKRRAVYITPLFLPDGGMDVQSLNFHPPRSSDRLRFGVVLASCVLPCGRGVQQHAS